MTIKIDAKLLEKLPPSKEAWKLSAYDGKVLAVHSKYTPRMIYPDGTIIKLDLIPNGSGILKTMMGS